MEYWKNIKGYKYYQVSSEGSVRSLDRETVVIKLGQSIKKKYKGKVLKECVSGKGYRCVHLRKSHTPKTRAIHRLVLEAFVGPAPEGCECAHNNGIRNDNRLENLRWDSRKANHADKIKHGTLLKGDRHPTSKLTEKEVFEIRDFLNRGLTQQCVAEMYGVARTTVTGINTRKNWGWL